MPESPGEGQTVKVVRNGAGGTKRVWNLATRNQAPSGRAPRPSSSERGRGRSSGLRRRGHRASARRSWRGSRRRNDGWSPVVRPRGEARRRFGVDAPLGERPRRPARRSRQGSDAMGHRRPPGDRAGDLPRKGADAIHVGAWAGVSTPVRARTPGEPARSVNQGDRPPSSDVPSHADRSVAEGPPDRTSDHHGNRLVGRRAVEGGTTGVVPRPGRHPRVAGRPRAAPRPHGRTRDLIPGSELSRVGALEGRRTSREGARAAIDRRRSDRARAGAGTSVPEGRYKAKRGAMPTDTRSGRPSAGTRQGPAMPRT